jgi:hypothetical protein
LEGFAIGFLGAFDDEAIGADVALAKPAPTSWAKAAFAAYNQKINFMEPDKTS